MWALIGLSAASRGTKAAVSVGFFVILAVLAYFAYSQIASSYERADKRGYDRATGEYTSKMEKLRADNAKLTADKLAAWNAGGQAAVAAYKADEATRKPAVEAATKERIVYVEATVNRDAVGIDAAGVGILRRNRQAAGIPASPAAVAAPATR